MVFLFFLIIFFILFIVYILYNSYYFQLFLRKKKLNKFFIEDFQQNVKGILIAKGYFATAHRVVFPEEYKSFSNKHKLSFSECYNIFTFKTVDANWEFFFHIVKEGVKYNEIMNLRIFPKDNKIRSEGNVEKSYSRLNIFTNNRYLTKVLEEGEAYDHLKWLLRQNGDILLISHNNLHFKIFLNSRDLAIQRIMDMIKALNFIKKKIYKEDVLEY